MLSQCPVLPLRCVEKPGGTFSFKKLQEKCSGLGCASCSPCTSSLQGILKELRASKLVSDPSVPGTGTLEQSRVSAVPCTQRFGRGKTAVSRLQLLSLPLVWLPPLQLVQAGEKIPGAESLVLESVAQPNLAVYASIQPRISIPPRCSKR